MADNIEPRDHPLIVQVREKVLREEDMEDPRLTASFLAISLAYLLNQRNELNEMIEEVEEALADALAELPSTDTSDNR